MRTRTHRNYVACATVLGAMGSVYGTRYSAWEDSQALFFVPIPIINGLEGIIMIEAANQDMKKVAVHELVHLMFDDAAGVAEEDTEAWIAEGIAILYASQTDLQYISKTEYPKLADLTGFDNFVDNGGYDYAGIYVWFFLKQYEFKKFLEVYRGEYEWQTLIYDGFEAEAIREFSMLQFMRTIFNAHGENSEPKRLSGGWTNHVFAAGELVLRFTSNLESGRLHREVQLAKLLPEEAGYPEIVDSGRAYGYDWMLCRRISGINLEDAWVQLSWKERADALEQFWQYVKVVHTMDVDSVSAYVNKSLWYITTAENASAEAELLLAKELISEIQCNEIKRYMERFKEAMKKAEYVPVHGI